MKNKLIIVIFALTLSLFMKSNYSFADETSFDPDNYDAVDIIERVNSNNSEKEKVEIEVKDFTKEYFDEIKYIDSEINKAKTKKRLNEIMKDMNVYTHKMLNDNNLSDGEKLEIFKKHKNLVMKISRKLDKFAKEFYEKKISETKVTKKKPKKVDYTKAINSLNSINKAVYKNRDLKNPSKIYLMKSADMLIKLYESKGGYNKDKKVHTSKKLKTKIDGKIYIAPQIVNDLHFLKGHSFHLDVIDYDGEILVFWNDLKTGLVYDQDGFIVEE